MRVSNRSRRAEAVSTLWIAREGSLITLVTKARRQGTATPPKQDSSAPRSVRCISPHLEPGRLLPCARGLQDIKGISQLLRTASGPHRAPPVTLPLLEAIVIRAGAPAAPPARSTVEVGS